MPIDLIVPEVGESITEVEIGQWLKNEGDAVTKDEPLVEIETDKVTLELPAPADGTLGPITHPQGQAASVGDVIGSLLEGGAAAPAPAPAAAEPAATAASNGSPPAPAPASPAPASPSPEIPRVMPAAQRLIDENQLDPAAIKATGPGGRILKEDVLNHLSGVPAAPPAPPAPAATPAPPPPPAVKRTPAPAAPPAPPSEREESVRMTPLRRTIAASLVSAQQTAALLTTFNEVDMTAVMDLRKTYNAVANKKTGEGLYQVTHGTKLGFMSFFVKASIDALKLFPAINAEVRGDHIIYKNHYDIGIAIGGGKGLVVPVLRDADRMSFADVEKAIGTYAKAAQANKIKLDDLQGGTFTITNGGVYGSLLSTPITNPPQSGVLGMHGIVRRPIALNPGTPAESIAVRPMMYIALTYDHRIVDGREAVTFLKRIKDAIEDPTRMLLEA
ncbi:MAG: 2-oxoglutarate dehydrogenase complex dihydrolipoyllysine-residue succinyltransferase [Planctomycetota bacterium]